jgi:hypothetical protein
MDRTGQYRNIPTGDPHRKLVRTRSKTRRGHTLVEVLIASFLSTTVLIVAMTVWVTGSLNWLHGQAHIDAESSSEVAIGQIEEDLREAMSVSVTENGNQITYQLPLRNTDGSYGVPLVWDGVTRQIGLTGETLMATGTDGTSQTLCRGMSSTDPLAADPTLPYSIFQLGAGTISRSLTITVATTRVGMNNENVLSRSRETIYLRNVPQLAQ